MKNIFIHAEPQRISLPVHFSQELGGCVLPK